MKGRSVYRRRPRLRNWREQDAPGPASFPPPADGHGAGGHGGGARWRRRAARRLLGGGARLAGEAAGGQQAAVRRRHRGGGDGAARGKRGRVSSSHRCARRRDRRGAGGGCGAEPAVEGGERAPVALPHGPGPAGLRAPRRAEDAAASGTARRSPCPSDEGAGGTRWASSPGHPPWLIGAWGSGEKMVHHPVFFRKDCASCGLLTEASPHRNTACCADLMTACKEWLYPINMLS